MLEQSVSTTGSSVTESSSTTTTSSAIAPAVTTGLPSSVTESITTTPAQEIDEEATTTASGTTSAGELPTTTVPASTAPPIPPEATTTSSNTHSETTTTANEQTTTTANVPTTTTISVPTTTAATQPKGTTTAAPSTTLPPQHTGTSTAAPLPSTPASEGDTHTTTKSSQPISSSCIWRGATCSGDLDTSLDRQCDEVIFNDDAGYCDCNGDGTKLSNTFECDDDREIFFCSDVCNSVDDEDEDEDSDSDSGETPTSAPPEPSPVVTPAPSPPDSGGDLPVFEIPISGSPCGDTCGSTLSVHTGSCKANRGHLIGECKCNVGWTGIDCKRAAIRYRSTIFVKAFVPMRFSTNLPSDSAKRAFTRTYLSLAASALNLDRVENLDVLGLDKVYTKNNQIVIEFIIHEPLAYKQVRHMTTRQEEAETIAQLADYVVSDQDDNGGGNGLFWDSRRVLLGVSSGADISITPRELKLSMDRQEPSKSKTRGEFIIRNTAVKGDELVIQGINFIGEDTWISIPNWKEGNEVRIPPEKL